MVLNKKASHVGMVLSFVMFVTFLTFLFFIVEPVINKPEDEGYLAELLKTNLIDYTSAKVSIHTIELEGVITKPCFVIKNQVGQTKIVVKNESSSFTSYVSEHDNFEGDLIIYGESEKFQIYFSEEFEELEKEWDEPIGELGCEDKSSVGDSSISSTKHSNYVFKDDATNLVEEYQRKNNNDESVGYLSLKRIFDIPEQNDFWFEFTCCGGIATSNIPAIPEGVNVYSDEIPISFLDVNGGITNGFLKVKVWRGQEN